MIKHEKILSILSEMRKELTTIKERTIARRGEFSTPSLEKEKDFIEKTLSDSNNNLTGQDKSELQAVLSGLESILKSRR